MSRTLGDWLRWQEGRHPETIALGLERVGRVWDRIAPRRLPGITIAIAGTNGKGSSAALLESIYGAAGFSTGCYTSPHLLRYNERIRIDGRPVEDRALCRAFEHIEAARRGEPLTYFEFGTLAAGALFRRAAVDVAILEVGLGGRLDAVNLFESDLALITNIGWDHRAWLGDTLAQIAREKAGIFKTGRPGVIAQRDPPSTLLERGAAVASRLFLLGRDFDGEPQPAGGWRWRGPDGPPISLPSPALPGRFQYDNAAGVLMAVTCLQDALPVPITALRWGLERVRLPGRMQVISGSPTWILDVAHNEPAARALAESLAERPRSGTHHAVFAMLEDKDARGVARCLADWVDRWHLARAPDSRALPLPNLRDAVEAVIEDPDRIRAYGSLTAALAGARRLAAPEDTILVFGSFTTVAAALTSGDGVLTTRT